MTDKILLSVDSDLFKLYLFYAAVLVVKVGVMSFLTSRQKWSKKVFSNPEDAQLRGGKFDLSDPDVLRVKRAHLNDLENVLPFLALCPLYLATGPGERVAGMLIRLFAAARVLHSFFYLNEISLWRSVAFGVGITITTYMATSVICFTF
ncbi:Microsomal glutathione S-transferase 1 [Amphibalanus amphitrite]|uniref:Microsomal glutathione S-transferase 1 n=1 Tax=Amphibalanus amphitrite TaxID=1232801 RepID=A0A6A4VQX7_AMPAM|nr:Microsomal glutathione S-transferase 1 [Amphibalanus amphitrite]